jgi:outer membrane protein, multidrug efflux system
MRFSVSGRRAPWVPTSVVIVVIGLIAMASACQVGPAYQAQHPHVPEKWAMEVPSGSPSWPAPDWWAAFKDPELNRLMDQARAGNPDVAASVYRVREADAQAEIAGAPLLPSVQASANAGPERQLSLSGHERSHVLYQGLINVQYEFDFWGKNKSALESAKASANAARFAQQVVWLTTSTGVANLYFQNLALLDRLQTANDNLARAQHTLDALVLAEHQGTVPQLAVVQEQAVVASLEAVVPSLQQQLAATRNALAILVGVLPEELKLSGRSLADLTRPEVNVGMPSGLLARRPDIQEAEANLIAANANIRVARAQFFPSFTLPLSAGIQSMSVPSGTVPPIDAYSVLGSVTQPIFQGGALRGKLDQTKARYQQLLVGTYRQTVLSAFSDVETALSALRSAEAETSAQQQFATLAQQSSGMALTSLHGGTGTTLDVLQSQSAVYSAQDALAQARLAYVQAVLSLIKALGGGWTA